MARDTEIAAYLSSDAALVAILTGGIYADSVIGGTDGFSRDAASPTVGAFDVAQFLKPSLMVTEGPKVPFGDIRDLEGKKASASQRIQLYFYQDRGRDRIDLANSRAYLLMQGHLFDGAYRAEWIGDNGPYPDVGPLQGNTTIVSNYRVVTIRG